jgi:hypothetical protein
MTAPPSFITVAFKGERSGTFPFTWGQHWVWQSITARAPHFADLSGSYVVELPAGCTLPEVADAIKGVLNRYETFRTRYTVDHDGVPHQVVLAEGQLRVEVRDVAQVNARATADEVEVEFNNLPFTLPELGLRAAVIVSDGRARFAVLCVFHLAMDCHGVPLVLDHFLAALGEQGACDAPESVGTPVDQALAEQDDQGVRRSRQGVKFWSSEVAKFPAEPFPATGHRARTPRYHKFEMRSPAVCAAAAQLAEELRVTSASVVIAAASAVLAEMGGNSTCGVIMAASHRYDGGTALYPGTLVQGVPVAVEVSDLAPRDLITRCHRAQMLAALSGHCHFGHVLDMLRESYGADGAHARLAFVANLEISPAPDSAAQQRGPVPGVAHLLPESRFTFVGGTPVESEALYLTARGTAQDFIVAARADTAVLAPPDIVDFLRRLELFLVNSTINTGET